MRAVLAWEAVPAAAVLEAWYLPVVQAASGGLVQIGPPSPELLGAAHAAGVAVEPLRTSREAEVRALTGIDLVVTERRAERGLLGRRRVPPLPSAAALLRLQGRLTQPRRLLFASGGGPQTAAHLPMLVQVAQIYGTSVTVLHVVSQQQLYYDGFGGLPLTPEVFLQSDMPEALQLLAAVEQLRGQGISADLRVESGLVAERILALCADYDLLAIGAQVPRAGLERFLLADLTRELLDDAAIPVLVLSEPGEAR